MSRAAFIRQLLTERFRVGSFYIPAEVRKQPVRPNPKEGTDGTSERHR